MVGVHDRVRVAPDHGYDHQRGCSMAVSDSGAARVSAVQILTDNDGGNDREIARLPRAARIQRIFDLPELSNFSCTF